MKISVVTVLGPDSEKYCHFSNSVRSAKCSGRNVYMYSLEFCYWRKMSADFLLLLAPSQSGLGLASRKMLEKAWFLKKWSPVVYLNQYYSELG